MKKFLVALFLVAFSTGPVLASHTGVPKEGDTRLGTVFYCFEKKDTKSFLIDRTRFFERKESRQEWINYVRTTFINAEKCKFIRLNYKVITIETIINTRRFTSQEWTDKIPFYLMKISVLDTDGKTVIQDGFAVTY